MDNRMANAIITCTLIIVAIILAITLKDACLGGQCPRPLPAPAPSPVAEPAMIPVSSTITTASAEPAKKQWKCKNDLATALATAGFHGRDHRQAWAIVMRESNGQNLIPGHPSFNGGDWGIWQVNAGAWGGERWFTTAAMSDPVKQSRIVYRILSQKGSYWRPWGLTEHGQLDATHYGSWGPGLWEAWIMAPFRMYWAQYPCKELPTKADVKALRSAI